MSNPHDDRSDQLAPSGVWDHTAESGRTGAPRCAVVH
jgi:hypothetical protein